MKTKTNTISNLPTTNKAKLFVAIDPGLNQLGLAFFKGSELLDATVKIIPKSSYVRKRLENLEKILNYYLDEKKPIFLVVEKTAFSKAHTGLLILAYYKILALARFKKLKIYEYVPLTIRKTICGSGHATKKEVMKKILRLYPELKIYAHQNRRWKENFYYNLFDAVAAGVAHLKITKDE